MKTFSMSGFEDYLNSHVFNPGNPALLTYESQGNPSIVCCFNDAKFRYDHKSIQFLGGTTTKLTIGLIDFVEINEEQELVVSVRIHTIKTEIHDSAIVEMWYFRTK